MDWTAGYASDIEYTAGFYPEQGPHLLNFACLMNEVEPVPLDRPYTYFELGCGRGLTANLLAAANPDASFYAADFNPAHVAEARELARAAGLNNLTVLENSFAELAAGSVADLPALDFITLHGIYTWVTAENRDHIIAFIGRYLKPGGVVYVSYNAMPGWSPSLPMQRLLVEYGACFPGTSAGQLAGATDFLRRLEANGAAYFRANPGNAARMEQLNKGSSNYLVHEYMHKHWEPMFHVDVARGLAQAKLNFVASAELSFNYPQLYLDAERRGLIAEIPDAPMRETLKDYFLNTGFRKDVYVRGARKLNPLRRRELLREMGVALTISPAAASASMKVGIGQVTGDPAVFGPMTDALAERAHTLGELEALPALRQRNFEDLVQTAALMTASGQATLYSGAKSRSDPATALRMNRVLAGRTSYGDDYLHLCSPLLGGAVSMGYVERLAYSLLTEKGLPRDAALLARDGWRLVMQPQGRTMLRQGVVVESAVDNEAILTEHMQNVLDKILPIWERLAMI